MMMFKTEMTLQPAVTTSTPTTWVSQDFATLTFSAGFLRVPYQKVCEINASLIYYHNDTISAFITTVLLESFLVL